MSQPDVAGYADMLSGRAKPVLPSGVVCLADVETEHYTWLWRGRLACGKIAVLDGDPGLGKTTMLLDVAARLTRGDAMPGEEGRGIVGSTVLLSAEDGLGDTLKPRLEAAGADLDRVFAFGELVGEDGYPRAPALPDDVAAIEHVVRAAGARLVIIDPIMAYLGAGVDAFRDQDIRRALHPVKEMAERTGAAVVIIRHLNKSNTGSALYRGGGSIGIIGAARTAMLVGRDPQDDTRRIVAPTKSNIGAMPPSLRYSLENDEARNVAKVVWHGTSPLAAGDLLTEPDEGERGALGEAVDFLRSELADGPVESGEISKRAKQADISSRTLRRARNQLGCKSRKGLSGKWRLELPAPQEGQGGQA